MNLKYRQHIPLFGHYVALIIYHFSNDNFNRIRRTLMRPL